MQKYTLLMKYANRSVFLGHFNRCFWGISIGVFEVMVIKFTRHLLF